MEQIEAGCMAGVASIASAYIIIRKKSEYSFLPFYRLCFSRCLTEDLYIGLSKMSIFRFPKLIAFG